MKKQIFFISASILIASCSRPDTSSSVVVQKDSVVTKRITFPDHTAPSLDSNYVVLRDEGKSAPLSFDEIKEIDKLMIGYIKTNQLDLVNLSEYKRQYFPSYNEKKEKVIWVNYFCSYPPYWKKSLVMVMDGGKCYFQFKINLTTKEIFDFMTNGNA